MFLNSIYTSVEVLGDNILYRGRTSTGKEIKQKVKYQPTLFIGSNKKTPYTDLDGNYYETIRPGGIKETRDFVRQYEGVQGFELAGMDRFQYCFIADNFKGDINWNYDSVLKYNIDIETATENGWPNTETALEEITAITIRDGKNIWSYGCGDFTPTNSKYFKSASEREMLELFLNHWAIRTPDVVTGWNIKYFDIPYLYQRIMNLLGEAAVKKLSPWGIVRPDKDEFMGKSHAVVQILGVSVLDYIELYRRYAPGEIPDNYQLNTIAARDLGEEKLDYSEYNSLQDLYKNDFQKFMEYNIQDTGLVERLDEKHKLLYLAMTLAYSSHVNYEDVYMQVRMWDVIVFNALRESNQVVPARKEQEKFEKYDGAYVKDPQIGRFEWVVSFDATSLYPSLIRTFNISPDMLVKDVRWLSPHLKDVGIDKLLNNVPETLTDALKVCKATVTPNGQFFHVDRGPGVITRLMDKMFAKRKEYKDAKLVADNKAESATTDKAIYEAESAKFDALQNACKLQLNSCYGALGSQYFRFYDVRLATAITSAGQLYIKYIEKKVNEYLTKIVG